MRDRDSNRMFIDIGDEGKYVLDLHRDSYINYSSRSIDILRINFLIITAIIAMLSFLYEGTPPFTDINIFLVTIGIFVWFASSVLCCVAYMSCQYEINNQSEVLFKDTKPQFTQTALSSYFVRQQATSEYISSFTSLSFVLSLLSVFIISMSVISTSIWGSALIVSIIIIFMGLVIMASIAIAFLVFLWRKRSTIRNGLRYHGLTPYRHTITRNLERLPWSSDGETYGKNTNNKVLITAGTLIQESDFKLCIYSKPIESGLEASGTLTATSGKSWDFLYRIMVNKNSFDIFVDKGSHIKQYKDCDGIWDKSKRISWDSDEVLEYEY